MGNLFGDWQHSLRDHSVNLAQFIGFRQSVLPSGMRIIHAYNSSGFSFTLLPDRGLDIWDARYNGVPLTWISQGAPHSANSGAEWLRIMNGGLLITCGLTHVGPPEIDVKTGATRDIHGLFTRLQAGNVFVRQVEDDDSVVLELSAEITQSALFGEQIHVKRAYRMALGDPSLTLIDEMENRSDEAVPFMVLYHFNPGYPMISESARLITANSGVYARDDDARSGIDEWDHYGVAQANYREQVFFHRVLAGEDGFSSVMVYHDNVGLQLEWDTTTAPYFTQWKNLRKGIYVSGIEPGNCIPEGRNAAHENGRLVMLQPDAKARFTNRIRIVEGSDAVQVAKRHISDLSRSVPECRLDDFVDTQ